MANMRNQVRLIGNLGKDPEIKEVGNDKRLSRFSVATNETYLNDKGEKVTETQWHNIVCWGKLVDITEKYLRKGSEVAIEGKISNRVYTDGNGVKRFSTEVIASELIMLGKKNSEAA